MTVSCVHAQASPAIQHLQAENEKLCHYLAAQKKVIASLERRVGRSLDTLGVHVKQLTDSCQQEAERQHYIHSIQHEVNSLCDLLADAMLLQRLEAGLVDVHLEMLPLSPILSSVTKHLLSETSTPRLIYELESNALAVRADQELLEAVLIDLVARGLRYSDVESPVVLGAKCCSNQVHLFVTAQRFAPIGNRDFATEIVLCCRRIEVQNGTVTCQQRSDGLQTVILALELAA
jgi:signal transduction histidine kinase